MRPIRPKVKMRFTLLQMAQWVLENSHQRYTPHLAAEYS